MEFTPISMFFVFLGLKNANTDLRTLREKAVSTPSVFCNDKIFGSKYAGDESKQAPNIYSKTCFFEN